MGRRGTILMLRYIHSFKDRHGTRRHYYRRNGRRIRLPGAPGEAEFMEAYARAASTEVQKALRGEPGTFNRLIATYEASIDFKRLKTSTQRVYRNLFARFAADHGHRLVAQMKARHVNAIVAEMASTPGAANSFLKRFKTLMVFAVRNDFVKVDPTYRTRGFKAGEVHTWNEAEINLFEAHWPIGAKERLAFALHLYTGQRRSDVYRMTWAHFDGNAIRVVQQKTGATLSVPVLPLLAEVLAKADRSHVVMVATEYGKAFSVAGYGNWINGAIRAAGLPVRCTAHGLRKAAARRLAEAGCTSLEIASITGHRTLAEVERYTRAADQVRLSNSAMSKQSANINGNPPAR